MARETCPAMFMITSRRYNVYVRPMRTINAAALSGEAHNERFQFESDAGPAGRSA